VAAVGTLVATLLFFGMVAERRNPMMSTGLTVLGTVWIGGMGAFLFEMVKADDYGWLIVATIVTVALMDVASFFFGRRVGRHRLALQVSPRKTVEGLIGGMFVAILVGVAFGLREPFDLGSGLALGAVVAVAAPFGDLAVSAMKRSIGVKDMGTLLPGHGGLLDRIDAMLFVIPLAWIVFQWTGLLT
jgi:CDP-diglyceride synthetase